MRFLNEISFALDITQMCFWGLEEQYSSIGSDNGLAPTRRQAITWSTNG